MDGQKLAITTIRDRPTPQLTVPARVSAALFVPTIDARILAANVKAQTPVMVKRLGMLVVGDDDARALGAYCSALRILLKGSARVHGLTAPNGKPIHSLRDYVRAYFDIPVTDDFKVQGSAGKRVINTINHYSNTYGGLHSGNGTVRHSSSPFEALSAYIARMFPKLASVDEAHSIVVDVTSRYEALVKASKPAVRPVVRSIA